MINRVKQMRNLHLQCKFILIFLLVLVLTLSTCLGIASGKKSTEIKISTVAGSTPTNGFQASASIYDIVDLPNENRRDVIKVNGAACQGEVVLYSLADYKDKQIVIHFEVDVKRVGAGGTLNWQVNNDLDYPSVTALWYATPEVWHHMSGRRILTPTSSNPVLYLTAWQNNASNTIYYIDNPIIVIKEGDIFTPDLTLPPLKSIYENDFLVGNVINKTYLSGKYFDLLKHHYNVVTPENNLKPSYLAPLRKGGSYQWEIADNMVNYMINNGIAVHGHVLVWHEQSPTWLTTGSKNQITENLKDYVTEVLTHFKGRIPSWDVVNEAIGDGLSNANAAGDWKKCVRTFRNPWYDTLGADYIELAFRTARTADPDVKLYYNDYGLNNQNKAEVVRKMIKDINDRYRAEGNTRNLIDGVGMQGHYGRDINIDDVRSSLQKLISLGIEIAVTELDISLNGYDPGSGRDTDMSDADAEAQSKIYADLFKLYKEHSAYIKRVSMWGIDDNTSWQSAGNPCLFDWQLNTKKAFYAVSNLQ
jgi:endo-1,4-beta-xylanase